MSKGEDEEKGYDRGYVEGTRATWLSLLRQSLNHLGQEGDAHRWMLERQEAITRLRSLCARLGDNDWDDNLHMADIIEKHLAKYIED